jgi:hypothetical protein
MLNGVAKRTNGSNILRGCEAYLDGRRRWRKEVETSVGGQSRSDESERN